MAIMKFNTPPEARVPPRASHVGHGEGVALVHQAFGDHVQGGQQIDSLNENYGSALRWSTAPYTGPDVEEAEAFRYVNPHGYRSSKRQGFCFGNDDTCKARATARWDPYCNAHGRIDAGLKPFDASLDEMPVDSSSSRVSPGQRPASDGLEIGAIAPIDEPTGWADK